MNRLCVLTALAGIEQAAHLSRDHEAAWAERGQAVWAMRLLQLLRGVDEELRGLRAELCEQAREDGVSLREIATAAGTTHATARKWANDAAEAEAPVSQNPFRDHGNRPIWTLDASHIREVADAAGLPGEVATAQLELWAAGQGWSSPTVE